MTQAEAQFNVDGLTYDPNTGSITRSGRAAGSCNGHGYIRVCADGVRVLAHRLAWRLMTGQWPTAQVDHINRDRSDNRWENLRQASECENHQNIATAGRDRGAYWDRNNKVYIVQVQAFGERHRWQASSYMSAAVAAGLIRRVLHGGFCQQRKEVA